jgi:signal transduction histidine kinase
LSLLCVFALRLKRSYFTTIRNVFYLLSIGIISSDIIVLDLEQARLAWYTVIIIPAFFLGGNRFGITVLAISSVSLLLIYLFFDLSYSFGEIFYGIFLYITVAVLTSFYESNRRSLYALLNEQNENLEVRVAQMVKEEQAKNELLLKQSRQAQMGEMIGVIAHQWKQPLAAISSASSSASFNLSFMNHDSKESIEESCQFVDDRMNAIAAYVETLTDTMDDFRNFFKPDKSADSVCCSVVVEKALHILQSSLDSKSVKVTTFYETTESVEIFANELMQVVLNIVKNAQDNFVEQEVNSGEINIKVIESEIYQEIHICDNGGGIPKEHIDNIFDSYFTTKSESHGTGIGLYMSKMIVDDHHNGNISVYNNSEGACFIIKIPLDNRL